MDIDVKRDCKFPELASFREFDSLPALRCHDGQGKLGETDDPVGTILNGYGAGWDHTKGSLRRSGSPQHLVEKTRSELPLVRSQTLVSLFIVLSLFLKLC